MTDHEQEPSDFTKYLNRKLARSRHKGEQSLAGFREHWESWSYKMKEEFKEWLERYVEVARSGPSGIIEGISFRFSAELDLSPPPALALLKAIACWEKGEDYAGPNGLEETTS